MSTKTKLTTLLGVGWLALTSCYGQHNEKKPCRSQGHEQIAKNTHIKNNIDNQAMKFSAKRITRSYCQTINSSPESVFPLICPVKEAEWLDDWDYKMIYSESGFAEIGAVFTTSYKEEEDTVWLVTVHDSINYKVDFVRVTPNSRASILKVNIREKDKKSSFVDITYIYTSLTAEGNKFIDEYTEDVFLEMVKHWENAVNYFLETGEKLNKIKSGN